MGRVRRALLHWTIRLVEAARANHEPVNVAPRGVQMECPVCRSGWPCEQATAHTERLVRLRGQLEG